MTLAELQAEITKYGVVALPAHAAHGEAQCIRWELADALRAREFIRDTSQGWPSASARDAVRVAERRIQILQAQLAEWVI